MWSPDQYLKFAQPRFRPARDLLARIDYDAPRCVYDLGCGVGNVTKMLAERWPESTIIGVDDSDEMLEKATKSYPTIAWKQQSIVSWTPDEPADVIYSNAALQWLNDHETLFPRLMRSLASEGILAVQMPRNFDEPSHTLIRDTVNSGPWSAQLQHLLRPSPVADAHYYYRLVAPYASSVDIWETQYLQVLSGKDPVKEWTKGTWLKQFLDALDEADRPAFEEDYAGRLREAYPCLDNGNTLFPFRRLFIVAKRC